MYPHDSETYSKIQDIFHIAKKQGSSTPLTLFNPSFFENILFCEGGTQTENIGQFPTTPTFLYTYKHVS